MWGLIAAATLAACGRDPAPDRLPPGDPEPPVVLDADTLLATLGRDPVHCALRVTHRVGDARSTTDSTERLRLELDAADATSASYRLSLGELQLRLVSRRGHLSVHAGPIEATLVPAAAPAPGAPGDRCAVARLETAAPDTAPSDAARAVLATWSAGEAHELLLCERAGLLRWELTQPFGDRGSRDVTAECAQPTGNPDAP